MNSYPRLLAYVWPYRRKFLLSVVFAVLVAILWGLTLSVAYPVGTVLLENKSLDEYLDDLIAKTQQTIKSNEQALDEHEDDLKKLDARKIGPDERERQRALRRQSRDQQSLSSAEYKLMVLGWIKGNVVSHLPKKKFNLLALIFVFLMAVTLVKGICEFVQETLIVQIVELSIMGVRKDCFRRVLRLDYQSVANKGTPKLMSHFTSDINVMANGLTLMGGKVIQEPLKAVACIVCAFCICWQLTLLSLLTAPVVAVVFVRIGSSLRRASHRMMDSMSRVYKTLEETFDGYKIVTTFDAGQRHRARFHRDSKEYYKRALKIARLDALTGPITEAMAWVAAFLALLPGCYLVLSNKTAIWGIRLSSGQLGLAELGALYVALAGIIDPARKLSTTYAKLKRAAAAGDRIFGLMDERSRVLEPSAPKPLPRHCRRVEFRKIHFAYARPGAGGAPRPAALEDVDFSVAAGEAIAVVGENGSGKSTLVNLLPRLYDPDYGSIRIDGVDIREVPLVELRRQIGIVTQETILFDETIYENIRYGNPDARRPEIEEAARQAHVTRFFDQMPEGLETRVGEKGGRLSGGQRQRIALARAILRNPSILILDEATSATDAQSERLIHEALQTFIRGRTTFLITHSVTPAVLELVDKIAVMDHGRLVALGPHDEVLATCPAYQRLFHARGRSTLSSIDPAEQPDGPLATRAETESPHTAGPAAILSLPLARSVRLAANREVPPPAPQTEAG